MTSRKEPGWLRGRAPALVATILSIGFFYVIARAAVVSLEPIAAAQLPPNEYSRLLRRQLQEFLVQDRRVSPEVIELARKTAISAPLSFEPFFVFASAAEQAGRLSEAIHFMEEARLRRRNFAPTRLKLATYYGRANRMEDSFSELEVVLTLRPRAVQPVMVQLTTLVKTAEGRRALAEALVRNPSWREEFFAAARVAGVRPADALALLNEVRGRQPKGEYDEERQLLVWSLVKDGQVRRARQVWLAHLPPSERALNALLSNSRFRGKAAGPPFGWELHNTDVGRSQLDRVATAQPYLSVEYYGGADAVLAEQLLALPSGTYRFRYALAGGGAGEPTSASVYWTLTCLSGSSELLRRRLAAASETFQVQQAEFSIPSSGCDGQRLRLVGEAGDVPATVNLRLAAPEVVQ